jgi:hypothetical protein
MRQNINYYIRSFRESKIVAVVIVVHLILEG